MKKYVCISVLVASAILCPTLTLADTQTGFTDVPSSSAYATYINDLQQKGITVGIGNGLFGPNDNISRADFTVWLIKAFNVPLDTSNVHFADMNGHWQAPDVQAAWDIGVVSGVSGSTFAPDVPLSREAAATMVWRYLVAHGVKPSIENFMLPTTIDGWAREGVAQCEAKHLFGVSFQSGTMQDSMTRQEAAALMDLALKTLNESNTIQGKTVIQ